MPKTWASFQNISDNHVPSRELGHSLANKARLNTCVKRQKDRNTWSKHFYGETEILVWSVFMETQKYLFGVLLWSDRNICLEYFHGVTELLGWSTSLEGQIYLLGWNTIMERQKYLVEMLLWSDRNTWSKNSMERDKLSSGVFEKFTHDMIIILLWSYLEKQVWNPSLLRHSWNLEPSRCW